MPTRIVRVPKGQEARQAATIQLKKLNEEIRNLESMENELARFGRDGWRSRVEIHSLLSQKQAMRKTVIEEDYSSFKTVTLPTLPPTAQKAYPIN